jgi:hypothetical protein
MPGPGNMKKSLKKKTTTTTDLELNTLPTQPMPDFHSFLEIAEYKSIAQFCTWASTTSDGVNLRLLWECTMDEGEKLGMKKGKKLGMKEGIEKGMDLGCEEGYQVTKEGFDKIIQAVKAKGTPKKPITHEMVMQTNDDLQQQSTAMQMTHTSTVNAVIL